MILSWSARRKLLYMAVAVVVCVAVLFFLWRALFTKTPTCTDGVKNGTELGVDCGGSCALLCPNQTRDPLVLWARAFPGGQQTYTAAAYIENDNVGAAAKQVHYSFRFYDQDNILILERDGVADLPAMQTIPIVEPAVDVGYRTVARTLFAFSEAPAWYKVSPSSMSTVGVSNQQLQPDGSRLSATVTNDTIADIHNITVAAVLFDATGTARGASKSFISLLPSRSSNDVVFTWPAGVPNIVRAEITPVPSF